MKKIMRKTAPEKPHKAVRTRKISYTLIGTFMIPVCLIVILGIISSSIASKSIMKRYEDSIAGNLEAVSQYADLLFDNVEDKATEIVTNDNVMKYYSKYGSRTDSEATKCYREAVKVLTSVKATCDYIYSFNIFSDIGVNMTSTSGNLDAGSYSEFAVTDEASVVSKGAGTWSGYHRYLDEKVGTKEGEYALSYTRMLAKGNGYLTLDIKYDVIREMLERMESGNSAITGIITPDGREIIHSDDEILSKITDVGNIFSGYEYFEKIKGTEEFGNEYVNLQGRDYLFSYIPVGTTGMMLCVLVPKSVIVSSASSIRLVTVIIVAIGSVLALMVGAMMAHSIGKDIRSLTGSMCHVAEGDFTTEFKTNRKDEFRLLAQGMTKMLANVRTLFRNMQEFGEKVNYSSAGVQKTAEQMNESMGQINEAMEEVAKGVAEQASDAEKGLQKVSAFSDRLNDLYNGTREIEDNSESAMKSVSGGEQTIKILNDKTRATGEMTKILSDNISDVEKCSKDIGSIVATIQQIADQTNLLSLNASIEAARAGQAGRGFAVVAEEIRELADQSKKAGEEIRQIVENIRNTTAKTAECAKSTQEYIVEQTASIDSTVSVFKDIAARVEDMVKSLQSMIENMSEMMDDKDEVLSAIRNIAAVSEQASASSEEVTATVNDQLSDAEKLASEADGLRKGVEQLNESIRHFIIDRN